MTRYPSVITASMITLPYSKSVEFMLTGTKEQFDWLRKRFSRHWVEHVTRNGEVHTACLDSMPRVRTALVRNRAAKNDSEKYLLESVMGMCFHVGEDMLHMTDQQIIEELTGRLTYYLEIAAIFGMPATWPDDYKGSITKYMTEEIEFAHVPVEGVTIKSVNLAAKEGGEDE